MCRCKTIHCRKPYAKTGKGAWPTGRNEEIDIRKLEWNMLKKKLYGSEEMFRVLHRRGQPHFSDEFLAIDNTQASMP